MKHVQNFESFDFSQTLPTTSVSVLTSYHSCDECDGIWKEFNEDVKMCKYCGSDEIEELDENEWYELSNTKLDSENLKKINKDRVIDNDTFVDLINIKKNEEHGN